MDYSSSPQTRPHPAEPANPADPDGPVLDYPSVDEEIAHGYTLIQVNGMAVFAAKKNNWVNGMDMRYRAEVARGAIVEHLLLAHDAPPASALILLAWRAMRVQHNRDNYTHGLDSRDRSRASAAFNRYWWSASAHTTSPEDAVVDRLAFHQIWASLDQTSRETLHALVDHVTPGKAAAELGIPYTTFSKRLRRARDAFRSRWHEGETLPPRWGYDRPNARINPHRAMYLLRLRKQKREARAADPNRRPPKPGGRPQMRLPLDPAELMARHEAGASQGQLARELGVSRSVIETRLRDAQRQQAAQHQTK